MSLPSFSGQAELFSTAGLSSGIFAETDRYRLFAKLVYPRLAAARSTLENCYCADNGRVAIEPVVLLGVSILQELDAMPDRQAVEMLRYHAGWNFALNRQLGDPVFHPTSLVNFRHRLEEHKQSALAFSMILSALEEAGLISRQSRQRLDSTQMFGRVARMSRLDCVREALRLGLQELEALVQPEDRPDSWSGWWERYVESQADYRASSETLTRKMVDAGTDTRQVLLWLEAQERPEWRQGQQVRLLVRVFGEEFEVVEGDAAPTPKTVEQLSSARVQNPHEPEATYAVKGKGEQKKEHVGYKVQVAETVLEASLAPGEPTRNFIVGMVTHPAYESDETGALKMEAEQAAMGLDKPPVQYVDAAYISTQNLVQAQAEGREIIGPAPGAPHKAGRFAVEDFQINVEERKAVCPAGKPNTQCSRLQEASTGKVSYRFEFSTQCHDCPLREKCLGPDQRHRTVVVGEHHSVLQARRQEQRTDAFKERMKHRNAIEGTQSELVRAHGLRRARYRGLAKTKLQNYFIGAACNVKRWIRREAWKLQQAVSLGVTELAAATAH